MESCKMFHYNKRTKFDNLDENNNSLKYKPLKFTHTQNQ